MHQTPPTVPLPGPAVPRRPRTSFYAAVGCLSVIAGLLLGVGGFFGVRALQDGGSTPVVDGEGRAESTDGTPPAEEPTVLDKTPAGADSAVPLGSTFPLRSTALGGEVEVTVTEVDWDATEEIHEANSFNEEPREGNRYLLLTVEGAYHGDGFDGIGAGNWANVTYVAQDGTEYARSYRVTPGHDELIGQRGVAEDGGFLAEFCFEVPAGLEAGGHFVFDDVVRDVDAGAWVDAV
ncbi:hypothetical protein CFK39_07425 [Brachybacterium avium]|uniref:DUF4352 domain-containing protein n=1 Tax=Brachybacterium avium TaxID=2017485 RepID=A0A220UDA1_9MICO|nr:hypothetical protein [Brachybacterium avium]ASK65693.1 hypothetical protein CFK39_07425 [Brachybacterium avium]